MKLLMLVLIAGTVLVGNATAMADRTDKPQGNATTKEIRGFLRELHRTRADLALAQASVFGSQWREKQCRFQSLEKPTWTQREEDLTAACVVRRLGANKVNLSDVMRVGECESHWNRVAYNPSGYAGIFQHAIRYWSGRVHSAMPEGWRIGPWTRWQNSRSQVVTTVVMVRGGGWGPWSCA